MSDPYGGSDPVSGWTYILGGIGGSLLGLMLLILGDSRGTLAAIAFVVLGLAGIVTTVGVIAAGVTMGMRRARID